MEVCPRWRVGRGRKRFGCRVVDGVLTAQGGSPLSAPDQPEGKPAQAHPGSDYRRRRHPAAAVHRRHHRSSLGPGHRRSRPTARRTMRGWLQRNPIRVSRSRANSRVGASLRGTDTSASPLASTLTPAFTGRSRASRSDSGSCGRRSPAAFGSLRPGQVGSWENDHGPWMQGAVLERCLNRMGAAWRSSRWGGGTPTGWELTTAAARVEGEAVAVASRWSRLRSPG